MSKLTETPTKAIIEERKKLNSESKSEPEDDDFENEESPIPHPPQKQINEKEVEENKLRHPQQNWNRHPFSDSDESSGKFTVK